MEYIKRTLEEPIRHHLNRGKSILLLGPRQTGKSTLAEHFQPDATISLLPHTERLRYEKQPDLLLREVETLNKKTPNPLILLDEIQKVPALLDIIQLVADKKLARFLLTGSSARKLRQAAANLLPGRVVTFHLAPLTHQEFPQDNLEEALLYGSLPGIIQDSRAADKEADLASYVDTYLEEEVRAEALVRNVGHFARFLELLGLESGKTINAHAISREIGVAHKTILSYLEIAEDCLIAERVDPITKSTTRKKLTKNSRYLIFDMGVRRLAANEGTKLHPERMGELFEQFVGLELLRGARFAKQSTKLRFWKDPDGPEVDWVLDRGEFIPIEVKWSSKPSTSDARHVKVFLEEHSQAKQGYVVCRTPRAFQLAGNITAIPWQEMSALFDE